MTASTPTPRTLIATLLVVGLLSAGARAPLHAQAPPGTDIFLAEVVTDDAGGVTIGTLQRLTDRDGYDNQPAFAPDGAYLYFTSMTSATSAGEDAAPQADIWTVNLGALDTGPRVLVSTEESSEYSPTPIPGQDALSVVRVEADGTQRLWRIPLRQRGREPDLILEELKPVGYHAWLPSANAQELVLFVLGEGDAPHRLVRASAADPQTTGRTVAENVGRSLHAIPGEDAFSFLRRSAADAPWELFRLDAASDEITSLGAPFGDGEDVAWGPDGSLWMARGTVLGRRDPGDPTWHTVADLADRVPGDLSRLAVSPDGRWLALVAAR